jgi:hypothetical protein
LKSLAERTCFSQVGYAICTCAAGFSGEFCETPDPVGDACTPSPCMNGAGCEVLFGQAECSCAPGFQGETCTEPFEPEPPPPPPPAGDACDPNPCANGGGCSSSQMYPGKAFCACTGGFSGELCEGCDGGECAFKEGGGDPCASSPCVNGACSTSANVGLFGEQMYVCNCSGDYVGENCDKLEGHAAGGSGVEGWTSAQGFLALKFNLDPADDHTGLRTWDCCVQMAAVGAPQTGGSRVFLTTLTIFLPPSIRF